jgi:hypothetical protein
MPVRRAFRTVWSGMSGGVGYELVAVSYQTGTHPKAVGLTLDGMHQGPEFPSFTATIDVAIQVNRNRSFDAPTNADVPAVPELSIGSAPAR